jgi:hypothetical protein
VEGVAQEQTYVLNANLALPHKISTSCIPDFIIGLPTDVTTSAALDNHSGRGRSLDPSDMAINPRYDRPT